MTRNATDDKQSPHNRKARSQMTKKPAKKAPPARSTATEQVMRNAQKAIEGKNFASMDDLNTFLASMAGPGLRRPQVNAALSLEDEAQELAFEAMEAETETQARKLAKRALTKDPNCVDALVLLTRLDARSSKDVIDGLQKAVIAGERSLGSKFIRENEGHFWLILETRPYMRALAELADVLRGEGIYLAAIGHYEKLLELNPNDNQGVRDPLLGTYLVVGDLAGAGKLLKKYMNDSMANFAWGRVLERFLTGDLPGASAALEKARKTNRFVELYMSGQKAIPKSLPDIYSQGSEEEAIVCLDTQAAAWAEHMEAVFWLLEQCAVDKAQANVLRMTPKKTHPPLQ
jgi:tetratricopeptide (TPR) repeat protein